MAHIGHVIEQVSHARDPQFKPYMEQKYCLLFFLCIFYEFYNFLILKRLSFFLGSVVFCRRDPRGENLATILAHLSTIGYRNQLAHKASSQLKHPINLSIIVYLTV